MHLSVSLMALAVSSATARVIDGRQVSSRQNPSLAEGTFVVSCPSHEARFDCRNTTETPFFICPETQYRGENAQVFQDIASARDCAVLCAREETCAQAAWSEDSQECEIKVPESVDTSFWVTNQTWTSIRRQVLQDPYVDGSWSDLLRFPVLPIAAYIVPQSPQPERMLIFSAFGVEEFGGETGVTQFADFNFVTGDISERQVSETHHDMFCPGISQLQDGRIIITGGSNADKTTFYEPDTNEFVEGPTLSVPRGYQSSTTTSSGKVFTIGGSWSGPMGGKNGELYDPDTNEWTYLPAALPEITNDHEGVWHADNHPWLFGWKNESVFHAGPSANQAWYDTVAGTMTLSGTRDDQDAMCGIFVLYDAVAGKLLTAGGAIWYNGSDATTHAHITTLGEPGVSAEVERVADLAIPRVFANAVVLPDGTVLVTGGQRFSNIFTDYRSVFIAELFDPRTQQWTQLSGSGMPRNYHSVSLLLPDGTVFSGAGGGCPTLGPGTSTEFCGDRRSTHRDGQIFTPSYLFQEDGSLAERPQITSVSQRTAYAGDSLTFTVGGAQAVAYSLIRMGTATHSVNTDQRRIPLNDPKVNGDEVTVRLPEDYGIMLPGFYYLFAVTEQGTPSIAETIHILL